VLLFGFVIEVIRTGIAFRTRLGLRGVSDKSTYRGGVQNQPIALHSTYLCNSTTL
jgi:hypothetical protein